MTSAVSFSPGGLPQRLEAVCRRCSCDARPGDRQKRVLLPSAGMRLRSAGRTGQCQGCGPASLRRDAHCGHPWPPFARGSAGARHPASLAAHARHRLTGPQPLSPKWCVQGSAVERTPACAEAGRPPLSVRAEPAARRGEAGIGKAPLCPAERRRSLVGRRTGMSDERAIGGGRLASGAATGENTRIPAEGSRTKKNPPDGRVLVIGGAKKCQLARRRVQPSRPSAEPNSQAAAGTGTTALPPKKALPGPTSMPATWAAKKYVPCAPPEPATA